MSEFINIAIDGPAGAGKSTIAKAIAKKKKYIYLDTGAMYRSFALFLLKNGFDLKLKDADGYLQSMVDEYLDKFELDIKYDADGQHVVVNGEDYTNYIRTPDVTAVSSAVASVPALRLKLVEIQRKIASENNVVMDGRDIGTYVLKDAAVKIFLTATAEERAKRRYDELRAGGSAVSYDAIYNDMLERDRFDSSRSMAPLRCAEDAVAVDSTKMSLDEVIEAILKITEAKL